jgi:hypothetical protein
MPNGCACDDFLATPITSDTADQLLNILTA